MDAAAIWRRILGDGYEPIPVRVPRPAFVLPRTNSNDAQHARFSRIDRYFEVARAARVRRPAKEMLVIKGNDTAPAAARTVLQLPSGILARLETRADGCFYCGWILESYREHERLAPCWPDYAGNFLVPVKSQLKHLQGEFGFLEGSLERA